MKLFDLGSDNELEVAYAKIIAKMVAYRIENGLTQSELAKKEWVNSEYDFQNRKSK
ncbi:hypothetical protein [Bacillus toyonensis]|uniref:hypothetical protein n=1 Tax=Bacillus toyonensis TaxID=155322 RepID=UPI0015CF50AC|nr:hypothetical protein [Bacillus toyonensis]